MFKDFVKAIQKNLQQMSKDSSRLFTVNVDTEELYNLYLDSFPAGTNEIYRERREYDCSCCRHFIRDVGNCLNWSNANRMRSLPESLLRNCRQCLRHDVDYRIVKYYITYCVLCICINGNISLYSVSYNLYVRSSNDNI